MSKLMITTPLIERSSCNSIERDDDCILSKKMYKHVYEKQLIAAFGLLL